MTDEEHISDILLVTGSAKSSKGLVALQSPLYSSVKSSHVALHVGAGMFIHSLTDKGVQFGFLQDIIADCEPGWRVIRLKQFEPERRMDVLTAATFYLYQRYNPRFMMKGDSKSSFCSELVAKAYQRAGISIFDGRKPSQTAPAHFDQLADASPDWKDVTSNYVPIAELNGQELEFLKMQAWFLASRLERMVFINQRTEWICKMIQNSDEFSDNFKASVQEMKNIVDREKRFDSWTINPE